MPTPRAPSVSASVRPSATSKPTATARARAGLQGAVIAIDPGHNGGNFTHPAAIAKLVDAGGLRKACDTTGTSTNDGYRESAFTFDVAQRLSTILRKQGATVVFTRTSDDGVGPCITERAAIGNEVKADAAISLHADGAPASGYGFHVIEPADSGINSRIVAPSARLAVDVRDAFRAGTGEPYSTYIGRRAIDRRNDLGGLNLSTVPKVFIECANMRNATDAARLRSAVFRERIAQSLADGITNYLQR